MIKIIGVRFRNAGKVYYFDPGDLEITGKDHVIVETARGVEYGSVIGEIRWVEDDKVVQPLRTVIRLATEEDDEKARLNRSREKEAIEICKEKIRAHNLEMKLIDAEYTFDGNKVLFYFTADGRVDFRDLVKDLAAVFKMRIELRQVGVRDETKLLGGVGICGRPLCCHTWLSDFVPVSIRMAKEQNLSLNPTKISGVCGRLMCCLKNEEETYEYLNSRLPSVGDTVTTPDQMQGEVHSVNVLRQMVKVLVNVDDEKEIREYPVGDLKFHSRKHREKNREKARKNTEESAAGLPEEAGQIAEINEGKDPENRGARKSEEGNARKQRGNSRREEKNGRRKERNPEAAPEDGGQEKKKNRGTTNAAD